MPIPPFDSILNILPPHLGDPREFADLSPYRCTVTEVCNRFATSPARKEILDGFLSFRAELLSIGIQGFQWLDGSFLEDIEAQEGRDPVDIDVVTFIAVPDNQADAVAAFAINPTLGNRAFVKSAFHVDSLRVPLYADPEVLVEYSRCWYALFAHRRDGTWKGMLRVELMDKSDDDQARNVLWSKP